MASVINQMRDDGDLEQHGGSGNDIKWLNARQILKGEIKDLLMESIRDVKLKKRGS